MDKLKNAFVKSMGVADKINSAAGKVTTGLNALSNPFAAASLVAGKLKKSPTVAPTPISSAQSNFTNNFGSSSNTSPVPTTITPPANPSQSSAKNQYTQSLGATPNKEITTQGGAVLNADGTIKTPAPVPTGMQTPTPTPTTPTAPTAPTARDNYTSAYTKYIESLKPSESVVNAKKTYNDYVASLNKTTAGLEGQGRGITTGIVRGQQEKLLGQTQPELARLQGEIGIAQGEQTAASEAAKAGLGLQKDLMTFDSDAEKLAYDREKAQYDRMTDAQKTAFDQQYKTDTLAQNKLEADRTFAENKRQFGLEYALKAQKQAADVAEKAQSSEPSPLQQGALTSAQDLLKKFDAGTGTSAVGKSSFLGSLGYGLIPGTERADFVTQFDNFKAQADLANAKYLKGSGAVSDAERKLLSNATKLDRSQSEKEFRKSLNAQIALMGGDVTVTLINPVTGESTQVQTNKQGIENALKDKIDVIY